MCCKPCAWFVMDAEIDAVFKNVNTSIASAQDHIVATANTIVLQLKHKEHERRRLQSELDDLSNDLVYARADILQLKCDLSHERSRCEVLTARVKELEEENREFKKVSRIIAFERENANLRKQIERLENQVKHQHQHPTQDAAIQTDQQAKEVHHCHEGHQDGDGDPDAEVAALHRENEELRENVCMLTELLKSSKAMKKTLK